MTPEQNAVMTVADLMALAARTAPKGKGFDTLEIRVLPKKDVKKLAARLEKLGNERGTGFFLRDAKNLAASDGCVLIGCRGGEAGGLNCGGCGYASCADFTKAWKRKANSATPFNGPNTRSRCVDSKKDKPCRTSIPRPFSTRASVTRSARPRSRRCAAVPPAPGSPRSDRPAWSSCTCRGTRRTATRTGPPTRWS